MRRLPLLACALVLVTSAPAAGSSPGTGGTAAPTSGGSVAYKQPITPRKPARGPIGPVATRFVVAPAELAAGSDGEVRVPHRRARRAGAGADRADAPRRARARRPAAAGRGAHGTPDRAPLDAARGPAPARASTASRCRPSTARAARCTAPRRPRAAARLEITGPAASAARRPAAPAPVDGVFPIAGAWSHRRRRLRLRRRPAGHIHQGQDVMAAAGTPLVAPVAGVRLLDRVPGGRRRAVRRRSAAIDGRDYVFMHLVKGSVTVAEGQALAAGPAVRPGRQHRLLLRPAPALRDLARRLVLVDGLGADRPAAAAAGVGGGAARLGRRGEIAQLVEHTTENRGVPGSSPGLAIGEVPAKRRFLRRARAPAPCTPCASRPACPRGGGRWRSPRSTGPGRLGAAARSSPASASRPGRPRRPDRGSGRAGSGRRRAGSRPRRRRPCGPNTPSSASGTWPT